MPCCGSHFQNGRYLENFWTRRIDPLMVTYHYVKSYVSIIIHLEVININVWNFNFPIGFYSNPHPLWTPQNMTLTPFTTKFHEILPSSSWDLPWTSSWSAERKEKENKNKNNNKKRSKNNKSPKLCLGDLTIINKWMQSTNVYCEI